MWITRLFNFLSNPFAELIGGWNARKEVAAKSAAKIAEAEVDFKVAQFEARADRARRESLMDFTYDMQVLKNRNLTFADEFLIGIWVLIFVSHFLPWTQPYMAAGWAAMGYEGSPPWWFEFGMVGILVSTLGLFRVLRLLLSRKGKESLERDENKKVLSENS